MEWSGRTSLPDPIKQEMKRSSEPAWCGANVVDVGATPSRLWAAPDARTLYTFLLVVSSVDDAGQAVTLTSRVNLGEMKTRVLDDTVTRAYTGKHHRNLYAMPQFTTLTLKPRKYCVYKSKVRFSICNHHKRFIQLFPIHLITLWVCYGSTVIHKLLIYQYGDRL